MYWKRREKKSIEFTYTARSSHYPAAGIILQHHLCFSPVLDSTYVTIVSGGAKKVSGRKPQISRKALCKKVRFPTTNPLKQASKQGNAKKEK